MNIFNTLKKIGNYCILPFQETRSFYEFKFISEKLPLMMISTVTDAHPWFYNPYELAEEITLLMKDRILMASKNMEILFFKSEKMLEMEIFTALRGEFIQNDYEKLAIVDSFKVLTYFYLNTFLINTCFLCQKETDQQNDGKKCTGTCQFDVKNENEDNNILHYLFQLKDTEDNKKLKTFGFDNKGKVNVQVDWKRIKIESIKKIQKVIKHKQFIPKKKNSKMVEIDDSKD